MSIHTFLAFRFPGSNEISRLKGSLIKVRATDYKPTSGDFIIRPFLGNDIYLIQDGQPAEWAEINSGNLDKTPDEAEMQRHQDLVSAGLDEIQKGVLKKIVLSRKEWVPLPKQLPPESIFNALHLAYPDAFVCLLNSATLGCWLSASPEPLIDLNDIAALAGSVQIGGVWTEKEILEHQLVANYIADTLNTLKIPFESTEVTEKSMGHIKHLLQKFSLAQGLSTAMQFSIAEALHPTPAVCGIPAKNALAFISEKEKYERDLYTGYWGPVTDQGVRLYVNLRTCQVMKNGIFFYAGGGINAQSNPEKEFEETVAKMHLLKKYIL